MGTVQNPVRTAVRRTAAGVDQGPARQNLFGRPRAVRPGRGLKVEWSAAAKKVADDPTAMPVAQSLHGLTRGTALAILLAERDLGFKPKRMADGTIRLEIVSRQDEPNTWPAGWPPDQAVNQIAPGYFKSTEIDIDKLPLADVLETAGDLMGLPVFIDRGGLSQRGIDAATFAVSHPKKKTTWSLALKSLTFQARCDPEIRMDESGTAFLWGGAAEGDSAGSEGEVTEPMPLAPMREAADRLRGGRRGLEKRRRNETSQIGGWRGIPSLSSTGRIRLLERLNAPQPLVVPADVVGSRTGIPGDTDRQDGPFTR